MPDEIEPSGSDAAGVAPPEKKHVCPHCGTTSETDAALCPQCGAAYRTAPRVTPAWGCLSAFGGVLAGVVAGGLVFVLVGILANAVSNLVLSLLLACADVLAVALAIRVIWLARRGLGVGSPFLIGFAVALAGFLSTCSLMLFSMGNFNFH